MSPQPTHTERSQTSNATRSENLPHVTGTPFHAVDLPSGVVCRETSPSTVPSPRAAAPNVLARGAALGLFVALAHANVEWIAALIWDVRLTAIDVAIQTAAFAVVGAMWGAVVGMFVAMASPHVAQERRAFDSTILSWALITHCTAALWILWDRANGATWLLASIAPWIIAGISWSLRRRVTAPRMAWVMIVVTAANVACVNAAQMSSDVASAASLWQATALQLLAAMLPIPICFALARRTRGVALSGVALAAFSGMGGFIHAAAVTPDFDWHVRHAAVPVAPIMRDDPNVVLIVLDTVRADHLELFGYAHDTMPKLTEFANRDADVTQAIHSTGAATLAAHASMFTGLYPHRHGAHEPFQNDTQCAGYGYGLRHDVPTLAELLAARGYDTMGIVGNYAVMGGYQLNRGFAGYDVAPGAAFRGVQLSWIHAVTFNRISLGAVLRERVPASLRADSLLLNDWSPPYRDARDIADRTVRWLSDRSDRPFFLYVNLFDAHDPFVPPQPTRREFAGDDAAVEWTGYIPESLVDAVMNDEIDLPQVSAARLSGLYDAELAYIDLHLNRIVQSLRERKLLDNTLLIITSDHGEALGEHHLLRHGTDVHEPQTRVPLVMRFPRTHATNAAETSGDSFPPTVPATWQFVDLMPSVLSMIGAEWPADLDGTPWGRTRDYALIDNFVREPGIARLNREQCAVVMGDYKYIESNDGSRRLYDLSRDPGECHNLAIEHPEIVSRGHEIVLRRNARVHQSDSSGGEDATMRRKLKSLGYLD